MKKSNTTRYLCAAAHIDRTFRTHILEKILNEEYRVISIPAGVDLLAVVKHCLDAKRRKLIRDSVVSIFFVMALINIFNGQPIIFFVIYFLSAWIAIVIEAWMTRYQIIAKYLLKHNFNANCVTLSANTKAEIYRNLSDVMNEEECNVIIYSGFSPFVGAGVDIGKWSFTLDISKEKKEVQILKKAESFTLKELYFYVDSDIKNLRLQEMSIQDKIFINGQQIRGDKRFLPDPFRRPLTHINSSMLEKFIEDQSDEIRHYKCIRIIGWQGEIVLSIFLRFVKLNQNLYVEASYFFLPPLKQEYHEIDEIQPNPTWKKLPNIFQETFRKALFLFPFAIFILLSELFSTITRGLEKLDTLELIRNNPMFDYGAQTSIRELVASDMYSHYFQKLDTDMYLKIIERQILDSITNFLDIHNIDTSDLRARQDTILNNGVIVTGGSVEAQNLTVGERAKSVMNNVTQAVSSVKGTQASSNKN